jgi:hypothetical protein
VVIAGLPPASAVRGSVNRIPQVLRTEADGTLRLRLPPQAAVTLEFAAPTAP